MKIVYFAAAAALSGPCCAQVQELDAVAAVHAMAPPPSVLLPQHAPSLSSTPALSAPFANIRPQSRTYLRDESEPDRMPHDPAVFGRYVTDPRLLAGVDLAPWLALETGYVTLRDRGTFLADYARPWEVSGALGTGGFNTHAGARVNVPVGPGIEAFGKVGVAYSEYDHRDAGGRSVTDADTGPYVGMGARYKVSEKASVTAGYERYGDSEKKWGANTNNNGLKAKVHIGF